MREDGAMECLDPEMAKDFIIAASVMSGFFGFCVSSAIAMIATMWPPVR